MSKPTIRGWCPGAYRPMEAGDGLVVRVRPPLGELTPDQARGLAALAQQRGNGQIDLTNRANLQLRGVDPAEHAALVRGLSQLGLLDADPTVEGRRNLILNPLRGFERAALYTRIGSSLAAGLSAPDFAALPSKFGFVVDIGPQRPLADVSGDVRIEGTSNGRLIVRADGWALGRVVNDADSAVEAALALARWFIASGGVGPDGRGRMAAHVTAGPMLPIDLRGDGVPNPASRPPLVGPVSGGRLIAAALGQLDATALMALADTGATAIRITPWRMVLLVGAGKDTRPLVHHPALLSNPADPLLRIHACTGAPGCPQATVATRSIARALAPTLAQGTDLHISGCAKGCAHPGPAAVTLVGREGRFDLINHGPAWAEPTLHGLTPDQAAEIIGG